MQKQSQSFLKMAGTLALSGVMLLGPTSAALADSSIGANISTSAGGTITSAGLLTASLGFISTGAAVNLNASSNFAVNIATGTSTGTVTIGNSLADVAIVDPQWSVTGAGAATFASITGPLTGNASTATALAANGANCAAGQAPLGVDASGAAEGCTAYITATLTDNAANALDIQEGTNNYINVNTSNGTENISFGNATTNPTYAFLGTGAVTAGTVDINGGAIDGTTIGGSVAAGGTFTTLAATGDITMNDAGADSILIGAAADTVTIISDTLSLADNNWNVTAAGLANFVSIGAGTAGTGAFTTLSASGALAANGGITFDAATDTIGAHTLGGTLDAATNIITNIGNAGTDFLANGGLTLANALTVTTGGAAITGASSVNGHLTLGPATSHIVSTQTTPPGVTDGGTPTITAGSTDTAGRIAADAAAAGASLTLTFNVPYATAPFCTISPANIAAAGYLVFVSTSTTTMVISDTDLTGGEWFYHCIGH